MNTSTHAIQHPAPGNQPIHVPMCSHKVAAGFPSPATDYIEDRLSLDEHLIQHRDTTFFVRAKGNSMVGAGIFDNDLLVVDRSLNPVSGDIVIAVVDGDLTVKRLIKRGDTRVSLFHQNCHLDRRVWRHFLHDQKNQLHHQF